MVPRPDSPGALIAQRGSYATAALGPDAFEGVVAIERICSLTPVAIRMATTTAIASSAAKPTPRARTPG